MNSRHSILLLLSKHDIIAYVRIEDGAIVVEGETEAVLVNTILDDADRTANKGVLPMNQTHNFVRLGQDFDPPLPLERISAARLLGRRVLAGGLIDVDGQTEYRLDDEAKAGIALQALMIVVMPNGLLRGSRFNKTRYLREKRMPAVYEYVRAQDEANGVRGRQKR